MASSRKMILVAALLALAVLMALPFAAGAQTATESINLGDTVEGTLEAGHLSAQYVYAGNRGDVVTIALESEQFDGYLTLLDPGLNEVAADDDSGGGGNPSIVDYTLATSGEFTIVVDSYNRLQTGDFSLTLTGTAAEVSTEPPEATASVQNVQFNQNIEFGQAITTTISPDIGAYAFNFEGRAGQQVTIELTSRDFDAYLQLTSAGDPSILAEDDDSAGNLNARIEDFVLPNDDTYSILAGSYGGGVEGEFTLTLTEAGTTFQPTPGASGTPTAIPTPGNVATLPANSEAFLINIGDTVTETIDTFQGSVPY
ncbi:MAG: PPC domain-containing protein, partial [Anaerolineae bacterium]|nr:PPC domain-containing protein [Anaerolineae bacterium]